MDNLDLSVLRTAATWRAETRGVVLGTITRTWGSAPRPVGSLVADGSVELGFQQFSELMNLAGIAVLGPLPPAIQTITLFSGGVATASALPDAARAVLTYMASPATADVKLRHGMEAA